ncbi:MAG TPA: murein biosynthesis integral membrane protein MurJ [Ktedonobacterales bacterium]|nr:murein biosynthesis integral membrane protein MurJ [Ktedonobacterales bacterium]
MAKYSMPSQAEYDDDPLAGWGTGPIEGLAEPQFESSRVIAVPRRRARPSAPVKDPANATGKEPAKGSGLTGSLRRVRGTAVNLKIVGAILTLATGTIAARALGVFNQTIISAHFGAGVEMDAYFATLALPVLLTNLTGSALRSSIIPVYVRLYNDGRHQEASEVLSSVLNVALLVVICITALALIFPQQAVRVMAPGAPTATIEAGAQLAPWIFPILLLNTVVGFITSISNATRRFGVPAFAAMLVPVGIFLGTVLLGNLFGITALAMGLMGGSIMQFGMMLVLSRKLKLHYRPLLHLHYPEVRTALKQFWPMLVGASIGQANPVIDQVIASLLGSGNISALNYALKVMQIPITVVFVAYSQAVYPYFSSQAAAKDYQSLKSTFRLFAWVIGVVTLCMTLVFAIFATPIIHVLFRHGSFSEADAVLTAATLVGFSVGLVPMAIEFMLSRSFNALQRNDLLMRVAVYTMVTNAALDVLLAHFYGLPGIALATSVTYLLTATLMLAILRGLIGPIGLRRPPSELKHMLAASPALARSRGGAILSRLGMDRLGLTPLRAVRNVALVAAIFAGVGYVTLKDAVQGLRLSVGLTLGVLFLRSPFGLLLTWAAVGAFYGVYVFDHSLGYVLALGSLPAFALLIWRERRGMGRWPRALWPYLAFLAWVLVGFLRSPLAHSQFAIDVLGYLDYGMLFLLAATLLTTRKRLEQFVTAVLCTSTALAALGLAQYLLRFGGFQEAGAPLIYRVEAIFGWSNSFAFYLILTLPLAMYRAMTARSSQRGAWWIALLINIVALLLTFSRGALVAVILMALVAALLLEPRWRRRLLVGMAASMVVGAVLVAIPQLGLQKRLLANLTTLNARTYGWEVLLKHLHPSDPIGHGLYSSLAILGQVSPDDVAAPHSLYLQVFYDHGWVGLGLLLATLTLLILRAVRGALRATGEARVLLALVAGGLVAAVAQLSVGNTFWVYGLGTYFWLLAALPFAQVFASERGAERTAVAQAPERAARGAPVPIAGGPSPG